MKFILPILFLFINLTSFGQTKEDFVNCLELIFDEDALQPAFSNDASNGAVIIIAEGNIGYRTTTPKITQIRRSLTQDDFYDSDHHIKVLRTPELERQGISEYAPLEIFVSGGEEELSIGLSGVIFRENQKYTWSYNMKKIDDEWEIIGSSLDNQRFVINKW